jgi:hypothetical protein
VVLTAWRSTIGKSAVSALKDLFDSDPDLKASAENRAVFAKYALDDLRFVYKEPDSKVHVIVTPLHVLLTSTFESLARARFNHTLFSKSSQAISGKRWEPLSISVSQLVPLRSRLLR